MFYWTNIYSTPCYRLQIIRCPVHVELIRRAGHVTSVLNRMYSAFSLRLLLLLRYLVIFLIKYDDNTHTPGLSGRSCEQGYFSYSNTAIERHQRVQLISWLLAIHLKHYRAVLTFQRCGSKHLVPNAHVGVIKGYGNQYMHPLFSMIAGLFSCWLLRIPRSA